jgi:hypothetical protein
MKAGTEFLFWMILFAGILIAWACHALVTLSLKLRSQEREIIKLKAEVSRCRIWLHHNPDHWEVGEGHSRFTTHGEKSC